MSDMFDQKLHVNQSYDSEFEFGFSISRFPVRDPVLNKKISGRFVISCSCSKDENSNDCRKHGSVFPVYLTIFYKCIIQTIFIIRNPIFHIPNQLFWLSTIFYDLCRPITATVKNELIIYS